MYEGGTFAIYKLHLTEKINLQQIQINNNNNDNNTKINLNQIHYHCIFYAFSLQPMWDPYFSS